MTIILTSAERTRLDEISQRLSAMTTAILSRKQPALGQRIQEDLVALEAEAPHLVDDDIKEDLAILTAATDEEKRERRALAAQYNAIIEGGKERGKIEQEKEAAAAERAALRDAMCGDCFMIHRPGQKECDV